MLEMLGTLDDTTEGIYQAGGHTSPKTYTVSNRGLNKSSKKKKKDSIDGTPKSPRGNTAVKQSNKSKQHTVENEDRSETDLDITPLPSEEFSILDQPLTVSDLNRSPSADRNLQQQQPHLDRNDLVLKETPATNVGLHGALKELKHLKKHSPSKNVVDKENRPMSASEAPARNTPGFLHASDQGSGQPFSRVMQILKGFNQNQSGIGSGVTGVSQPPPLLQMTPERDVPHSFPRIPMQAWQETTLDERQGSSRSVPRMPLLHLPSGNNSSLLNQGLHQDALIPERDYCASVPEIPHKDKPLPFGGPPVPQSPQRVPLLNLQPYTYRPMTNISGPDATPCLVPPGEIIAYEQKKYRKGILKKKYASDFIEQQMASRPPQQLGGGIPLLKAKVDPFEPRDERNNEKRKQRRKKIQQDQKIKLKKSDLVDEDQESVSYSHAVTQVTPATTPRIVNQGVQVEDGTVPHDRLTPQTEPDEEPVKLHDGYALTPGMFDAYLVHQDELGSAADNNAKLQYRAAMGTHPKKVNFRNLPKQDVSTETDGPGWADRGTSMGVDMGLDPVQDAIAQYGAARRPNAGGMLPPDVFLGLRFTDNKREDGPATGVSEYGRAFINVVDIQGDLIEDIVGSVPQKDDAEGKETLMVDMKGSPVRHKFTQRAPVRHSQKGVEEEEERVPGPDSVTANLLGGQSKDGKSISYAEDLSPGSQHRSKAVIRQRLNDMNLQAKALEQMANKMEKEFQNTKLLLHTVEQMGEVIDPSERDPDYPPARMVQPHPHSPESEALKDFKLKPSHIRQYNREDKEGTDDPSQFLKGEEDGISPRSRVKDIQAHFGQSELLDTRGSGTEKLDLTGLSGVSDIIGEVVAQGDIDTTTLGLTKHDTAKLLQRALDSARSAHGRTSEDVIKGKHLESPRQQLKRTERTEEEKQQLKEWMEKRRKERMKEYHQKRGELREKEVQPYKPSDESKLGTLTLKEMLETEQLRIEKRRLQQGEYVEKRIEEASHLMTDMLSERPDLPEPSLPRTVKTPRATNISRRETSTSPARREISPARGKGGKNIIRKIAAANKFDKQASEKSAKMVSTRGHQDDGQDLDRMEVRPDYYMSIKDSYDQTFHKHLREREGMKIGNERGLQSQTLGSEGLTQTSTGIAAYTKYMEEIEDRSAMMETRERPVPTPRRKLPPEPQEAPHHEKPGEKTYRPKPFTEMVKLQRPELTRKGRKFRPKPVPYVDRLSQLSSRESSARGTSSINAQQRLYGTKRIPGIHNASRTAPRTVKTYTERLREMKRSSGQYPTTPKRRTAVSREYMTTSPQRMQQLTHRGLPARRKPLKTMTYAEQLQSLQPPKELYRTGEIAPHQTAVKRSHKGLHQPKTYSQRLQELQPHGTATFTSSYGGMSERKLYRTTPLRSLVRSGPYPDPYREDEDLEDESFVSPWSVDDDVKRILHDDGYSNLAASAATDADISDISELQRLAGDAYADMVDVNEIAVAASVSEGSIMSFIDWDQVDQLIGDVY